MADATATATTTQDTGNPFDVPLNSELQESQQRQQVAQSSPDYNPFDEPLASEKAEAAHAANAKANPEDAASNTRQMLVSGLTGMPTPNMTDADKASFERGKAAGAVSVPAVAGAMSLSGAAPVIEALAEHLPSLDKAYKILTGLGGATYTLQPLKDVLKIMGGGSK